MFLACDFGNSKIKAALFSGNNIVDSFIFQDTEELKSLYSEKNILHTGISSVVPEKSQKFKQFLDSSLYDYYEISGNSKLDFKISYKTPETLGMDRICSAAGAYFLNGKLNKDEVLVSIDFGTATTINVILYPGEFLGGIIGPGILLMSESLHSKTSQLPKVTITDYKSIIGTSTKESIASGLLNYTLGVIEKVISFIEKEYLTKEIKLFLTGGNAGVIIPFLTMEFIFEKNLVLYGIKRVTELNSTGQNKL